MIIPAKYDAMKKKSQNIVFSGRHRLPSVSSTIITPTIMLPGISIAIKSYRDNLDEYPSIVNPVLVYKCHIKIISNQVHIGSNQKRGAAANAGKAKGLVKVGIQRRFGLYVS